MSVPAGSLGSTEVAPRAAPFIFAGGGTDVFDSSICYPAKQGPHSSKPRGGKSGTEQDWARNRRKLGKEVGSTPDGDEKGNQAI